MATLAIMKERICGELGRADLNEVSEFRTVSPVSAVHDAIMAAIDAYSHEEFYFSQSRAAVAFNTVANQDIYTSADVGASAIARIVKIEYAMITVGGTARRLVPRFADAVEDSNLGSGGLVGTPAYYTWYAESIRLEPIPVDVFAVRFGCILKIAAPATEGEASNRWMVDAERMIRSRAKAELYAHVIKKTDLAETYMGLAGEANQQLQLKTENLNNPESRQVVSWDPYG